MRAFLTLGAGLVMSLAAPPIATADQPASSSVALNSAFCSQDDATVAKFHVSDRITLTEYERVDPNPNDRLPAAGAFPNYRLRAEVSGDFTVGDDGIISIPILGRFQAAGKSAEELRDAVSRAFDTTLGHVGIITISVAERQPIYVDGLVKNPGAFRYTSGLTALHAVSLAGGYQDIKLESHQFLLQTMQELENGEQAKKTLERSLARETVLRAELESTRPAAPPQALIDVAGETRARALLEEQLRERETVIQTENVEVQRESRRLEEAKQALDVRSSQIEMADDAVQHRESRLRNLEAMLQRGSLSSPYYESAQAEYLDTVSRKKEIEAAILQTRTQMGDAQSNLAKIKLDARLALQRELSSLALQIAQLTIVYRTHLASLNVMDADPNISPEALHVDYEIVRRLGAGVASYRVPGSCLLQPGDLVRVHTGEKSPSQVVAQ